MEFQLQHQSQLGLGVGNNDASVRVKQDLSLFHSAVHFHSVLSGIRLLYCFWGFPGGASGKEPVCQCRRHKRWGLDP